MHDLEQKAWWNFKLVLSAIGPDFNMVCNWFYWCLSFKIGLNKVCFSFFWKKKILKKRPIGAIGLCFRKLKLKNTTHDQNVTKVYEIANFFWYLRDNFQWHSMGRVFIGSKWHFYLYTIWSVRWLIMYYRKPIFHDFSRFKSQS